MAAAREYIDFMMAYIVEEVVEVLKLMKLWEG